MAVFSIFGSAAQGIPRKFLLKWERLRQLREQDEEIQRMIKTVVNEIQRKIAENAPRQWNQSVTPAAVLLDWDDHLIDSKAYYRKAGEAVIGIMTERYGLPEPTKLYREKGKQKSSEYYREVYGDMAEIAIKIHQNSLLNPVNTPELKAGAKELLTFLEMHNIPYAIVSDTVQERLENDVKRVLGGSNLRVPPLIGTSKDIPLKPQPHAIRKALALLFQDSGYALMTCDNVVLSGDRPDKDGLAAENAGISHVIIPTDVVEDTSGWKTFSRLDDLTAALAETVGKKFVKPGYFQRFSYAEKGISYEQTHVISGDVNFVESPATDNPEDGITLSDDERDFHNLRWIAKRGKNLDGSGQYSAAEKLAAGFKVVGELLTDRMVDEIAGRCFAAAREKREGGFDPDQKIVIHLPHIGGSKNMLRIALLRVLTERLNEIAQHDYPGLNVEFRDASDHASPIFNVLSMAESLEGVVATQDIESLSGHDAQASLTIKRSTGSLMERIAKQALFNYRNFQPGDMVILADDHVQTGSTFITLYQQLVDAGVNVVALASLAAMPESKNLQAHPDMLADMEQAERFALENYLAEYPNAPEERTRDKFNRAATESLALVGLNKGALSNREAMTIMASLVDGSKPGQLAWFKGIMDKYGCDPDVVERKGDSLLYQAQQPGMDPVEIKETIYKMVPSFLIKEERSLGM